MIPPSSVHDTNNNNDNNGMVTQIGHFQHGDSDKPLSLATLQAVCVA